ncbi:MAG: hypothetical protein PHR82_03915 [Endomicrobiaceae bacterium]|nr:hypothetical protein [Endomicrobiaceae bacterium]
MYKVNLATEIIKGNQIKFKFFKVVNGITVLIGVTIILLIGYTLYKKINTNTLESSITNLINTIDNKRSPEVLQMEKLWEEYNFELLSVSEELLNSTKYGLILKEFANRLPNEAIVSAISMSGDNMNVTMNVPQEIMSKLKSFHDYTTELKTSFDKTFFINNEGIKILSWITEIDKKKRGFETLEVQIPIYSRKRL